MDKELKESFEQISKKLDVVCALLLKLVPKDEKNAVSLKDQIRLLDSIGLRPVEMSKITGKTQTHINKELVSIRKKK